MHVLGSPKKILAVEIGARMSSITVALVSVTVGKGSSEHLQDSQQREAALRDGSRGAKAVESTQHGAESHHSHMGLHHCVVLTQGHQALQHCVSDCFRVWHCLHRLHKHLQAVLVSPFDDCKSYTDRIAVSAEDNHDNFIGHVFQVMKLNVLAREYKPRR
jgi:hypothetical protein